ncbi:hypothetical protein CMV_004537 [Castanea mollissima]|uniref:Uncharacterized protein n=1 Tax=Castanea mollissima TaxID=60419 RepID=A0A8J4W4V7_9ROSI|nr:hypothetical protein CMV_004537 [Castanea mollissima]
MVVLAEALDVTTEELRELFGGIGQEPFFTDYDMRGFKINVAMAEMSAPKAPPAYDQRIGLSRVPKDSPEPINSIGTDSSRPD